MSFEKQKGLKKKLINLTLNLGKKKCLIKKMRLNFFEKILNFFM